MRALASLLALVAAPVLAACATTPTVDDATRAATLEAAETCAGRIPGVEYRWDGAIFRVKTTRRGGFDDYYRFQECMRAEMEHRTPFTRGRVAATAPPQAIVPITVERGLMLAPVSVNGTYGARILVDTGASMTVLGTSVLKELGIAVPASARRLSFRIADGRVVQRPVVRLASLRVGDMTVEDIDVAVAEWSPPGVGLLGQDFLGHFRVTLEPERRRLVLDTIRTAAAPGVTGTATRTWAAPVAAWAVGDTWRFGWRGSTGAGSYESRVVRDETIDGVRHVVLDQEGRRLTLRADTAGLRTEHAVDRRLIARYSPAIGHPWPLRVGATWDLEADWQDGAGRPGRRIFLRCAATEEARLTVPAGTFDTLRVVCQTRAGMVVRETWWAAEPRTWIRERRVVGDAERVEELQSYSVR
jgi:clan AA aspartic protease (TIGR02281 family)